jgi:hypothetical protein
MIPMTLRNPQAPAIRSGSLFGGHPGSVTVREGVDLTAPILEEEDLREAPGDGHSIDFAVADKPTAS